MAKKQFNKVDIYEKVTATIIAQLEKGVAPWAKPWTGNGGNGLGAPKNAVSGRPYSGVNQLVLWCSDYATPLWLTFKQAKDLGGCVNKGEKGTTIVFWKFLKKEEDGKKVTIPFARAYVVFNVEQTSVAREKYAKHLPPPPPANDNGDSGNERRDDCEAFIKGTGAKFSEGGDRACYSPNGDWVKVPAFDQFKTSEDYYATSFHELVHWTGHNDRCKRHFGERFGSDAYAAEELVAELGAAFLCAEHELQAQLQHAEYVDHWLKVLKGDNKAIFTAASKARQAVQYLNEKVHGKAAASEEESETEKEAA